ARAAAVKLARSAIVAIPPNTVEDFILHPSPVLPRLHAGELVVVEHGTPPIDDDARGVDERRLIGSKKNRSHRNLLRPADAFSRMEVVGASSFRRRIGERIPVVEGDLSFDVAGRDRIHSYALRG